MYPLPYTLYIKWSLNEKRIPQATSAANSILYDIGKTARAVNKISLRFIIFASKQYNNKKNALFSIL